MIKNSSAMLKLSTAIALVGCAVMVVSNASAQKAGVAAAVNRDANRTPPEATRRQVVIGDEIVYNELIETSSVGQAQVLMLDRTALTIGPSASLVIDKFIYDSATKTGDMGLTLRRGLLRFVGGSISKKSQVQVKTPVGVLGIRGGVALINVLNDNTVDVTFLFGTDVAIYLGGQEVERMSKAGFKTRVTRDGADTPSRVEAADVRSDMQVLQGRAGAAGGLAKVPTEVVIAAATESALPATDVTVIGELIDESLAEEKPGVETGKHDDSVKDGQEQIIVSDIEEVDNSPNDFSLFGVARVTPGSENLASPSQPQPNIELFGATDGNGLYYVQNNLGEFLAGEFPDFFTNDEEGPSTINKPFYPADTNFYDHPDRAASLLQTEGGVSQIVAERIVGEQIYEEDFLALTYWSFADYEEATLASTLTVVAGKPGDFTREEESALIAYTMEGDRHRLSRHVFSTVGQFDLTADPLSAIAFTLDDSAIQTPLYIDLERNKVFLASKVQQGVPVNLNNPQNYFAFQVGVVAGDYGPETNLIGGGEFVLGHYDDVESYTINSTRDVELRAYGDENSYVTLEGVLRVNSADDSGEGILAEFDEFHIGQRTDIGTTELQETGTETQIPDEIGYLTYELYAAGYYETGSSGLMSAFTNPEGGVSGGGGNLRINRQTGNVTATVQLSAAMGMETETIDYDTSYSSAYLNDDLFGIASDGSIGVDDIGGFLVSGKATATGDAANCLCHYLHWGYWGVLQFSEVSNDHPYVAGFFVAGEPTVDMPLEGQATYSGVVDATWHEPTATNPDGITTVISGTIEHTVEFQSGYGSGEMTLPDPNLMIYTSSDNTGNHQISFYFSNPQTEGYLGEGDGIFTGPNAKNMGVVFSIENDGAVIAGAIRAERGAIEPLPPQ